MYLLKTLLIVGLFVQIAWADTPVNEVVSNKVVTSIYDIRKNGVNNQPVILKGRLTRKYSRCRFEFTDLEGDVIEVELNSKSKWGHIRKNQLIEIQGKLDLDFFSVAVLVKKATPLNEDKITMQ